MKRQRFITFLAWPNAGWPQDLRGQHSDWGHLIVALSGMAYMLSFHSSLSQELGKGRIRATGFQQCLSNLPHDQGRRQSTRP